MPKTKHMDWRLAHYKQYQQSEGLGKWNSGILTIGLPEWKKFHNEITILLDLGDFVWRGQQIDWPLKSKFDRMEELSDRSAKLQSHTEAFERAIKGRRGNNPPELDTDKKIWSLGQHYGLITPLLDWTESPFVAAYFAFEPKILGSLVNAYVGSSDDPELLKRAPLRYIYGLSKDIIRWGPTSYEGGKREGQFIEWVPSSSDENPRLLNQRGLSTKQMSPEIEIEKVVAACYANDLKKGLKRIIFVKIQILERERDKCLRNLNSMNINPATLFPDLIGAAEYCNMKLEIKNYS